MVGMGCSYLYGYDNQEYVIQNARTVEHVKEGTDALACMDTWEHYARIRPVQWGAKMAEPA